MPPSKHKKGANQYTKRLNTPSVNEPSLLQALNDAMGPDDYLPARHQALWESVRSKQIAPEVVEEALDQLTAAEDVFILQRVAGHPMLSIVAQLKLVDRCMGILETDNRYAALIAMGLARNPNLSSAAAEQLLIRYPDDIIKAEIRMHPNAPSQVLAMEALAAMDFD